MNMFRQLHIGSFVLSYFIEGKKRAAIVKYSDLEREQLLNVLKVLRLHELQWCTAKEKFIDRTGDTLVRVGPRSFLYIPIEFAAWFAVSAVRSLLPEGRVYFECYLRNKSSGYMKFGYIPAKDKKTAPHQTIAALLGVDPRESFEKTFCETREMSNPWRCVKVEFSDFNGRDFIDAVTVEIATLIRIDDFCSIWPRELP